MSGRGESDPDYKTPSLAYYRYTTARDLFLFGFGHGLDAFGAGPDSFSGGNKYPLQIGVFSFLAGRIIFSAQLVARHYER